jgi:ATP/maltotriose-dependent transcriptional regulator MalT
MRQDCKEITGRDLPFSDEEIERYFEQVLPAGLSAHDMREVTRYTEGWIAGLQNKEIASRAAVSVITVKTHTRHIFEKPKLKTRVQAVRPAKELRLIGSP